MTGMARIPDNEIDLMMTSPPYLWLRDYGFEGQWGLEDSIDEYLDKMVEWMREVKRVLKPTGSAVVNIGDLYGGGTVHSDWSSNTETGKHPYSEERAKEMRFKRNIKKPHPSSLLFIPFQFGWRCVSELELTCHNIIPWIKPNGMPFQGENRFANKWEPILWFTKKPTKYFFDLDSVRVRPKAWDEKDRAPKDRSGQQTLAPVEETDSTKKQDNVLTASGKPDPTKKDFNHRWQQQKNSPKQYKRFSLRKEEERAKTGQHANVMTNPKGKNPGDFIIETTKPFMGAHFATYPIELPLHFIKSMCPQDGIVLDPFAGSGTTAQAAIQLGREWILIEGLADNKKIIETRLAKFQSERMTDFEQTESD